MISRKPCVLLFMVQTLTVLAVGCVERPEVSSRSWIAFVSDRDGNDEIYRIRPDGTQLQRLTRHDGKDLFPSWSPDGDRIAFVSKRAGNFQILAMSADGKKIEKLVAVDGRVLGLRWSPDGRHIAFSMEAEGEAFVYVMDVKGGEPRKLIDGGPPAWSPDGTTLIFARGQLPHLWLVNLGGQNARRHFPIDEDAGVTKEGLEHLFTMSPVWFPNGRRLLYTKMVRDPEKEGTVMNDEVFTMNSKGEERQRLTVNAGRDIGNDVSPKGKKIVFTSDRDGNTEIYVMNADGTELRNLTEHEAQDHSASWR